MSECNKSKDYSPLAKVIIVIGTFIVMGACVEYCNWQYDKEQALKYEPKTYVYDDVYEFDPSLYVIPDNGERPYIEVNKVCRANKNTYSSKYLISTEGLDHAKFCYDAKKDKIDWIGLSDGGKFSIPGFIADCFETYYLIPKGVEVYVIRHEFMPDESAPDPDSWYHRLFYSEVILTAYNIDNHKIYKTPKLVMHTRDLDCSEEIHSWNTN